MADFYNYQIAVSDTFKGDLADLKKEDSKLRGKVMDLVVDMAQDPFSGIGKPEPLKGDLSGCWSRRITGKHRLVYKVEDDVIQLLSCYDHYDDK